MSTTEKTSKPTRAAKTAPASSPKSTIEKVASVPASKAVKPALPRKTAAKTAKVAQPVVQLAPKPPVDQVKASKVVPARAANDTVVAEPPSQAPQIRVVAQAVKTMAPAKTTPVTKTTSKPNQAVTANAQTLAAGTAKQGAAPAPAAQSKVRIFQIYYRPEHREALDPAFEPYNNEGDKSPLLEFNVFRKLANSHLVDGVDLWGALSWKFKEKTGLTGEQLKKVIADNPGCDVYYCNPFPEIEGIYQNLWMQGETCHPNFLILCREFFKAAGLDERILIQIQLSKQIATSNYFVATPDFWRGYISFVNEIIQRAEKGMPTAVKEIIYSSSADRKGLHAGASYMPFIIERLLSVYIGLNKKLKTFKFECVLKKSKMNTHIHLLRQMKDAAIISKSNWLAACWINYRNLYLVHTSGDEWCNAYLGKLSPNKLFV